MQHYNRLFEGKFGTPPLVVGGRDGKLVQDLLRARKEPEEIKIQEGRSTTWGAEQAIKKAGKVPDIIYHEGDWGKEPMIVVLGRDAEDVARKAIFLADRSHL